MTGRWLELVRQSGSPGATDEALDEAQAALGVELPADYRAVMKVANGGEAQFGESWVRLYRAQDLVERGEVFREFARPFTRFGSNGSGESYAWDHRAGRSGMYVTVPDIDIDPDSAVPCGASFEEFLSVLHQGIPFDRSGEG